jgi:branched-chain amino acid transport system substrate-binding protein
LKIPLLFPLADPANEFILAEIGDASLGMVGSDWYFPRIDTDINKKFVDAYSKKYQSVPTGGSAGGYIAVTMFLEAVKATNGDTSHDAIISALHNLRIDTPAGVRSYDEKGLGKGNLYIAKVVKLGDGYAWEPVFAYEDVVIDIPK